MRRTGTWVVALVSISALTSGCALDLSKDKTPAEPKIDLVRAGRPLAQAEAKAAVPARGSAPAGYAPTPKNLLEPGRSGRTLVRPARCNALYDGIDMDYLKASTKSYATFVNSDKTYLGVGVASRPGRLVGLEPPQRQIGSCRRFVVRTPEGTTRLTATALVFPKMGEHSVAIRYTMRTREGSATYDAVRIQAGHTMVSVDALSATDPLRKPTQMEEAANGVLLTLSR